MRKLVMSVLMASALALVALPASAAGPGQRLPCIPTANGNGAATCTINLHDVTFILPGAPPCSGVVDGATSITANGVGHVTALAPPADEFWVTETLEGSFVNPPPDRGAALVTGHVAMWFGIEWNNQNRVLHFTGDGNGDGPAGRFGFHSEAQWTMNANGETTAFHITDTCR